MPRSHVFFNYEGADMEGETRHAELVMKELSEKLRFRILGACGQSMFGGFSFWIEYDEKPEFPDYLTYRPWVDSKPYIGFTLYDH